MTPPLHSRFKRAVRSAVVSAEPLSYVGLADFLGAFFFVAGFLRVPLSGADDLTETSLSSVCAQEGMGARVATQTSATDTAPNDFENISIAWVVLLKFQAAFSFIVRGCIDWQAKTFAGPGTQVMVLAARTAKRPGCVAQRINTGAFAGGTRHDFGWGWCRHVLWRHCKSHRSVTLTGSGF